MSRPPALRVPLSHCRWRWAGRTVWTSCCRTGQTSWPGTVGGALLCTWPPPADTWASWGCCRLRAHWGAPPSLPTIRDTPLCTGPATMVTCCSSELHSLLARTAPLKSDSSVLFLFQVMTPVSNCCWSRICFVREMETLSVPCTVLRKEPVLPCALVRVNRSAGHTLRLPFQDK